MMLSKDPKKVAARQELERLTREYLERGGKIEEVPPDRPMKEYRTTSQQQADKKESVDDYDDWGDH